jgi:hypothetical protein
MYTVTRQQIRISVVLKRINTLTPSTKPFPYQFSPCHIKSIHLIFPKLLQSKLQERQPLNLSLATSIHTTQKSTNNYNFPVYTTYNNEHKMLKHKHLLKYYVQLLLILATCFGRYCPSSGHNIKY